MSDTRKRITQEDSPQPNKKLASPISERLAPPDFNFGPVTPQGLPRSPKAKRKLNLRTEGLEPPEEIREPIPKLPSINLEELEKAESSSGPELKLSPPSLVFRPDTPPKTSPGSPPKVQATSVSVLPITDEEKRKMDRDTILQERMLKNFIYWVKKREEEGFKCLNLFDYLYTKTSPGTLRRILERSDSGNFSELEKDNAKRLISSSQGRNAALQTHVTLFEKDGALYSDDFFKMCTSQEDRKLTSLKGKETCYVYILVRYEPCSHSHPLEGLFHLKTSTYSGHTGIVREDGEYPQKVFAAGEIYINKAGKIALMNDKTGSQHEKVARLAKVLCDGERLHHFLYQLFSPYQCMLPNALYNYEVQSADWIKDRLQNEFVAKLAKNIGDHLSRFLSISPALLELIGSHLNSYVNRYLEVNSSHKIDIKELANSIFSIVPHYSANDGRFENVALLQDIITHLEVILKCRDLYFSAYQDACLKAKLLSVGFDEKSKVHPKVDLPPIPVKFISEAVAPQDFLTIPGTQSAILMPPRIGSPVPRITSSPSFFVSTNQLSPSKESHRSPKKVR